MWRWDRRSRCGWQDNLKSFVRYLLSENAAFLDDGVLVPAAGTSSIQFGVWGVCCLHITTWWGFVTIHMLLLQMSFPTPQLVSTRIHDVFFWNFRTVAHSSSSSWTSFTDGSRLLSTKEFGSTKILATSLLQSHSPNDRFVEGKHTLFKVKLKNILF